MVLSFYSSWMIDFLENRIFRLNYLQIFRPYVLFSNLSVILRLKFFSLEIPAAGYYGTEIKVLAQSSQHLIDLGADGRTEEHCLSGLI